MEHTSLTKDDINNMCLAEIEATLEGINANNSPDGNVKSGVLEGPAALDYLIKQQGGV